MKLTIKVLDRQVQKETDILPLQYNRLKKRYPKLIKLALKAMMQDKANEEISRATNEQI